MNNCNIMGLWMGVDWVGALRLSTQQTISGSAQLSTAPPPPKTFPFLFTQYTYTKFHLSVHFFIYWCQYNLLLGKFSNKAFIKKLSKCSLKYYKRKLILKHNFMETNL
jgi:hypothetical protein